MNRATIQKFSSLLVIIVFLGFIFGLSVLSAYKTATDHTTYSYFENRNLAEFPHAEKSTVSNGKFFSDIENWCKDHTAKRNGVLAYHTRLNMDVLKRPVVNETVITDDVLLPYNPPETVCKANIIASAEKVARNLLSHSELCKSYGGKFYYVAVPCQYVYYEDAYPWYLNSRAEFTEVSSSALFAELDKKGISYIDMMSIFDANGHLPEYSSISDNHYSIFGALETYRALIGKINEDTELDLHIMTEDDYTLTTLPNPYMGSRTRKLLGLKKTDEKLSIITPKEDIPFLRWDYGNEDPSASTVYALPANDTDAVLYNLYMGDDCSITEIRTSRPELPTVLVYGDSFTNALESVIWYNFDTMYSLDFRYFSAMTLDEFIAEHKPDIVVCIRDYEQLVNPYGNGQ